MNIEETIYCIVNCLLYIWLFRYHSKRNGYWNVGSYLLLIWAVSAVGGFVYELNPIFFHYNKIALIPFIYLFLMNIILFQPIIRYKEKQVIKIRYSYGSVKAITIVLILITLPCFIENVIHLLINGAGALNADMIDERYDDVGNTYAYMSRTSEFFTKVIKSLKILYPFLFFHFLSLGKRYKNMIIGLCFCMSNIFIESFCIGSRVSIVVFMVVFFFAYLIYYRFIDCKTHKILQKYIFIAFTSLVFIFAAITIVRFNSLSFSDRTSPLQWVCEYVGEAHGNFNADAWNVPFYSGDDTVSRFLRKYLLGQDFISRDFSGKTQFPDPFKMVQFYTAVGAYYMSYGPWITAILIILISYFVCRHVKSKQTVNFSDILLFAFYAKVPLLGFTYFIYAFDAQQLVTMPILIFVFNRVEKHNYSLLSRKQ